MWETHYNTQTNGNILCPWCGKLVEETIVCKDVKCTSTIFECDKCHNRFSMVRSVRTYRYMEKTND
jgi:hypothetical protein